MPSISAFPAPGTRLAAAMASLMLLNALAAGAQDSTLPPVSDPPPYILDPTRVKAGAAFDLQVLSYDFNCGHRYDHIQTEVTGNRIDIRFTVESQSGIICPAVYRPYGPKVAIAALERGAYAVYVTRLQPCQVLPVPCKIMGNPALAGTLYAYEGAAKGWFIEPDHVPPGQAFTLKLLSDEVGNCRSRFDRVAWALNGGALVLTFTHRVDTSIVCIQDLRPFGPSFAIDPLPAGVYPVFHAIVPECAFPEKPTDPVCNLFPIPQLADTLVVAGSSRTGRGLAPGPWGSRSGGGFAWQYQGTPTFMDPRGRLGADGRRLQLRRPDK